MKGPVSENGSRSTGCENPYWPRLRATGNQPGWPAQSGPEPLMITVSFLGSPSEKPFIHDKYEDIGGNISGFS